MSKQSIVVRFVLTARAALTAQWIVAVVVIMLCSSLVVCDARATTIDDFTQPALGTQFFVTTLTTLPAFTSAGNPVVFSNTNTLNLDDHVSPSSVIGGERKTSVNVFGTLTPNTITGVVGHDNSSGLNAMQIATNGTAQSIITSTYLPGGASPTIDLTSGGTQSGLDIKVLNTDEPLTIKAILSNSSQQWTDSVTVTTPYDAITKTYTPVDALLPFSAFGPGAGTSVNQISFVYNFNGGSPLANIDYNIGSITTTNTPEPASAVLMGLGLVVGGLGCRQARRRAVARAHAPVVC